MSKKIRLKASDYQKILKGELTLESARRSGLLIEDVPVLTKASDPTMLENDSLDAQVDKFLLQADKSDGNPAPKQESFLREADEETPPPAPTPAAPAGPPIDAVAFCDSVARLVEKSDNLLDVKGTIIRRALNYVTKNYDAKQAKEVQQVLEGNFGLTPDASDPYEDDVAPPATGAGSGLQQA